jgi:hypothetical protein
MTDFEGHPDRDCGEHRTTGNRAWCHDCQEWCYPDSPCKGCELPQLRIQVADGKQDRDDLAMIAAALGPKIYSTPQVLAEIKRLQERVRDLEDGQHAMVYCEELD